MHRPGCHPPLCSELDSGGDTGVGWGADDSDEGGLWSLAGPAASIPALAPGPGGHIAEQASHPGSGCQVARPRCLPGAPRPRLDMLPRPITPIIGWALLGPAWGPVTNGWVPICSPLVPHVPSSAGGVTPPGWGFPAWGSFPKDQRWRVPGSGGRCPPLPQCEGRQDRQSTALPR